MIEDYVNVRNVTSTGLMLCLRAQLKAMQAQEPRFFRRGVIVNVASSSSASFYPGELVPGKMTHAVPKYAGIGVGLTKRAGELVGCFWL